MGGALDPPLERLNGCAGLALAFPVPLSARTFRLQEGKGSGLWDTVVGSDSLDSDLTCSCRALNCRLR
jgi:hypothetical protein